MGSPKPNSKQKALNIGSSAEEVITIRGARQHNLKNVDLSIPRNQLVVFTGVSGSGKSSLAFDTIFAEGQRRYVESLSAYARQFLGQVDKPDVDSIEGLSPAISIDQKSTSHNLVIILAQQLEQLRKYKTIFVCFLEERENLIVLSALDQLSLKVLMRWLIKLRLFQMALDINYLHQSLEVKKEHTQNFCLDLLQRDLFE